MKPLYLEHFGLQQAPFRITPHTAFFFAGAQRGELLQALSHALQHEQGVIKLIGEVGTGKTMLLRLLLENLAPECMPIWLANPSLEAAALLGEIAQQLGLPASATAGDAIAAIQQRLLSLWGEGRRALVLIDEAHAMPPAALEQIRLLANLETAEHKLLQIVLFGQPELDSVLAGHAQRALRERITQHFRLQPLTRQEVAAYLAHRLAVAGYRGREPFTAAAQWALARASGGLTRRINILADKALLAAYAAGRRHVGLREVRAAARDAALGDPLRRGLALASAAGLAGLLAVAAWSWPRDSEQRTRSITAPALKSPPVAASRPLEEPTQPALPALPSSLPPALQAELSQRLHAAQRHLAATAGTRWCLQLGAAPIEQAAALLTQIERLEAAGLAPIHLYAAPAAAPSRLGLIWGNFANAAEARRALAQLPALARSGQPYARSLASLQPAPAVPR